MLVSRERAGLRCIYHRCAAIEIDNPFIKTFDSLHYKMMTSFILQILFALHGMLLTDIITLADYIYTYTLLNSSDLYKINRLA